jgi:hypothetical protein
VKGLEGFGLSVRHPDMDERIVKFHDVIDRQNNVVSKDMAFAKDYGPHVPQIIVDEDSLNVSDVNEWLDSPDAGAALNFTLGVPLKRNLPCRRAPTAR